MPGTSPVPDEDVQVQLELATRIIDAMERLGEPLDATAVAEVKHLEAEGHLPLAASTALALLETRMIVGLTISPEARVSVQYAARQVSLLQGGWRLYLVRVNNPQVVPGTLHVTSPNAVPVHGVEPPSPVVLGRMGNAAALPTTRGDMAQRWLDMVVQEDASVSAALEPVPVDYKVLALYSRDAGLRSASLAFDIDLGTGDLAARDRRTLHFRAAPARDVRLEVIDQDGRSVTCSLLITDRQGRVLPAQARRTPPDFFFQRRIYRKDCQSVTLPAGEYSVVTTRGPEYVLEESRRVVPASAPARWQIQLRRWIDPGAKGWISGDHHVHGAGCAHYDQPEQGVGPEMLMPQVQGEALGIAAVLNWSPGFYTQKLNFKGEAADADVSTADSRLHYDLEVSGFPSSHCGHLALLLLNETDYPGTTRIEQWPSANSPVLRWARQQHAVAGYAHAGVGLWAGTTELPNDVIPPFDGIGANDYIVTLPEGLVDFIGICNHPPAAELNIWYHTLNVGLRSGIAGETDWPCFFEESIGMGRSYVKLDGPLSYSAWCEGVRHRRSYVSEGRAHFMNFAATAGAVRAEVGGELFLPAPGHVAVEVDFAARLEPLPTPQTEALRHLAPMDKPYWHIERTRIGDTRKVLVELLVNGLPVEARSVEADGNICRLEFDFVPSHSCWIALRVLGAAHTNPIWLTVANRPIRLRKSAQWCRTSVDQCWRQKMPRIREAERSEQAALYERARQFYDRMLSESVS